MQQQSWWRLGLPLAAQLLLVLFVPLPNVITLATGATVYLETAPVDPYDLLRGRYMRLGYAIEQQDNLDALPGWDEEAEAVYIVLAPSTTTPEAVEAWQPVRISRDRPTDLAPNEQVIYAENQGWLLSLNLSEYYIPEAIGDQLEADMADFPDEVLVEVKVDRQGNSVLTGLWVQDRKY